jgi:hypothetical protein
MDPSALQSNSKNTGEVRRSSSAYFKLCSGCWLFSNYGICSYSCMLGYCNCSLMTALDHVAMVHCQHGFKHGFKHGWGRKRWAAGSVRLSVISWFNEILNTMEFMLMCTWQSPKSGLILHRRPYVYFHPFLIVCHFFNAITGHAHSLHMGMCDIYSLDSVYYKSLKSSRKRSSDQKWLRIG